MILKSDTDFDATIFFKFSPEHSKVSKLGLWWHPFIQSRKCMSLNCTEKLCVMAMKNDGKLEEELTRRFKIDTTIWRILTGALKFLEDLHFNGLLLTKVYNVWAKKAQKIAAKFEGKLTCAFKNDMRNLANMHMLT